MRSRTNWPINGWRFTDFPISPQAMGDPSMSFDVLCRQVQSRRVANPRFNLSTDFATIQKEVDQQNALRMIKIKGGETYVVDDGGPDPNPAAPPARLNLRAVAGRSREAKDGVAVLVDWLGQGGVPVMPNVAEARAKVCSDCPLNQKGDLLDFFTQAAAGLMRSALGLRETLSFKTSYDSQLNVCSGCGCVLKLKVHVPIQHIEAKMPDGQKEKLDPRCWVLKEMSA
jgi:hypothetical protein